MANNIEMTTKCSFTIPGLGCTLSSLLVGTGVGLASFLVGVLLLFSCGRLLHWILTILRRSRRPAVEDLGEWGVRPAVAVLHRSQRLYNGLSTLGVAPPPSYSEAGTSTSTSGENPDPLALIAGINWAQVFQFTTNANVGV